MPAPLTQGLQAVLGQAHITEKTKQAGNELPTEMVSFKPLPSSIYHPELDLTIEFLDKPNHGNARNTNSRVLQLYTPSVFNRSIELVLEPAVVHKYLDAFFSRFEGFRLIPSMRGIADDLLGCSLLCDLPPVRWSFGIITFVVWYALDDLVESWWNKGQFDGAHLLLRRLKSIGEAELDAQENTVDTIRADFVAVLPEEDIQLAMEVIPMFKWLCDNCHMAFGTADLALGFRQTMTNTLHGLINFEIVVYESLAAQPDRLITHEEWIQKRWISSGQAFCAIFYYPDSFNIAIHSDFDLTFALCSQMGCLYNDITSYLSDRKSGDRTSWVLSKKEGGGLTKLEALHAAARKCNEHMEVLEYVYHFAPTQVRGMLWANVYVDILELQAARTRRHGWKAVRG